MKHVQHQCYNLEFEFLASVQKNADQWRNKGGQRGQLPPGAAGEGAQNSLTINILWVTNTKSEHN